MMRLALSILGIATVAGIELCAIDTDTNKFFRQGIGPETVKLPADQIYPRGRIFPFSFYSIGGGSSAKRGELLPAAEREADQREILADGNVTLIGPQYELNDASLDVAAKYRVKMVYSVQPKVDGTLVDRKYLQQLTKEGKTLDREKIAASIAGIVKAVAHRPEIAWWDLTPEELRSWEKNEGDYLQLAADTIRANDPLKRPVFMYEPGHRDAASLAKTLSPQDLSCKGMYLNYSGMKHQRVWARWSIEQEVEAIRLAGKSQVAPIALPEMFQQPKPEEMPLLRSWVRHDVYCALVNGAKGIMIFSASKRPNFTARADYLKAYLEVARELNGPLGLGQVFLFGKRLDDLEVATLEGPEKITLKGPRWTREYPAVSVANLAWNNARYVILVNSAEVPVKVVVSRLVYGSGVTVKSLFDATPEFTAPEGDFEVELKPLEVAAFKIFFKKNQ